MVANCPRCGLRFERSEGHWTGDLGLNTIVSFTVVFGVLLGGFLLTYPNVPGTELLIATIGAAIMVPIAFFPLSKTIWLAIDLQLRPLEAHELDEPNRWTIDEQ